MMRAIKAFVILVIIVMIGEMFGKNDNKQQDQSQTEQTEQTEQADPVKKTTEKAKKIANLKEDSIDIEKYIRKDKKYLLNAGSFVKEEQEDIYDAADDDKNSQMGMSFSVDENDKVKFISIDQREGYNFCGITYDMDRNEVEKLLDKISDKYQYGWLNDVEIVFWQYPGHEVKGHIEFNSMDGNCGRIKVWDNDGKEELLNSDEKERAKDSYIIFDSAYRKLTDADIAEFDTEKLIDAIDEIYAREGMIFNDSTKQDEFSTSCWYKGKIEEDQFTEENLSDVEKYNVKFLQDIINQRNYEKEKKASITIEDICGTYVDSEKGYKLVIERITMPGDFEPLDNRIQYKIYQKDQSLFAEQDSTPYYDGNIGKGDYTLINNGDGTITLEYNTGEEICKFTKVQD